MPENNVLDMPGQHISPAQVTVTNRKVPLNLRFVTVTVKEDSGESSMSAQKVIL